MSQERKNGNARTWLITGASSGLGYALATYVLEQGDRVAMGARTLDTMADLAERYPEKALALTLDVTSAEQRAAAVQQTEARLGSIDVLVNNAAIDFLGAIEEQDERDVRAQFEVNFFGAVALLRLVLPGMRGRKRGTIVNVSSFGAQECWGRDDGVLGSRRRSDVRLRVAGQLWGLARVLGLGADPEVPDFVWLKSNDLKVWAPTPTSPRRYQPLVSQQATGAR